MVLRQNYQVSFVRLSASLIGSNERILCDVLSAKLWWWKQGDDGDRFLPLRVPRKLLWVALTEEGAQMWEKEQVRGKYDNRNMKQERRKYKKSSNLMWRETECDERMERMSCEEAMKRKRKSLASTERKKQEKENCEKSWRENKGKQVKEKHGSRNTPEK